MIIPLPKFRKGQKVYCYLKGCTFLTTINDSFMVNGQWNYYISGENLDGTEMLECPECALSININDKKVIEADYIEE